MVISESVMTGERVRVHFVSNRYLRVPSHSLVWRRQFLTFHSFSHPQQSFSHRSLTINYIMSKSHTVILRYVNEDTSHQQIHFDCSWTGNNIGIPIKLLFEAEGMKVTVEVSVVVYAAPTT